MHVAYMVPMGGRWHAYSQEGTCTLWSQLWLQVYLLM